MSVTGRCQHFEIYIGLINNSDTTSSCFSRTRDLLYSISVGEKLTTPCFIHRTTGVNEKNLQTLPQEIPTVTQTKRISNRNSNTHNIRNIKKIKSETLNITKGQKNLNICSINPRSVKNKTIAICDFILSNDFDLWACQLLRILKGIKAIHAQGIHLY
jgi:hypothetical protein